MTSQRGHQQGYTFGIPNSEEGMREGVGEGRGKECRAGKGVRKKTRDQEGEREITSWREVLMAVGQMPESSSQ